LSSENWKTAGYLEVKPKLHILLLGSYDKKVMNRLQRLEDFLLSKNYLNTALVCDFDHPKRNIDESKKLYNLRKSEYWLPEADIPVFVFFQGVDNSGVSIELKHMIDTYPDMSWRSIVAINDKPSEKPVSSLVGGITVRWKRQIQTIFFKNDDVLKTNVKGALTNILEPLYFQVIGRCPSLWETSK
jgi:hypothetical protein